MRVGDKTVDLETIMSWGPCYEPSEVEELWGDRKTASLFEIIESDQIDDEDKVWLSLHDHFFDECELRMMAAAFAETKLGIFEKKYPNDKRPRNAIMAARLFACGEIEDAALAAASDATLAFAVRAATWAARVTARDATWAARVTASDDASDDASDTALTAAARAAAWAATWAASATSAADRAATWAASATSAADSMEIIKTYASREKRNA